MLRLMALLGALMIACQGSGTGSLGEPRATPTASPSTPSETIELDFDEPGTVGRILFRLPYGEGKETVGYLPPCMKAGCEPPCPCTTQIQPVSFVPLRDGGVWVLDPVKERLARFSSQGDFVTGLAVPGNDFRNFDVVLVNERLVVFGQRGDFSARLTSLESGEADTEVLRFDGEPAEASRLTSSRGRLFTSVFVADENVNEEEIPVEVARDGTAAEVPGVPFLDGWIILVDNVGLGFTTIPLDVTSTHHNWSLQIHAVLRREVNGEEREVPGTVSWELAVAERGAIHLLIRAQTERGGAIDAFWLVNVSPEGVVGEPVKLRGPSGPDDQQSRRLALGAEDRPVAMWAGKNGLIFEALP